MEQPYRRIWTRGAKAALLEECRSGLLAGAALLEDLDPECKAKMMKVIVVNNFLTKLHTVQKTHVIAVFLLAGSYFISTSFQEHEKIFHLSPSKQWEISK